MLVLIYPADETDSQKWIKDNGSGCLGYQHTTIYGQHIWLLNDLPLTLHFLKYLPMQKSYMTWEYFPLHF